jgi:hypothetical protein
MNMDIPMQNTIPMGMKNTAMMAMDQMIIPLISMQANMLQEIMMHLIRMVQLRKINPTIAMTPRAMNQIVVQIMAEPNPDTEPLMGMQNLRPRLR